MNILVIGGTRFVGRHIVGAALTRGHRVTVFHRGTTPLEDMPEVAHILGDREIDLSALGAGAWDAVIDTNGYVPKHARAACTTLAHVPHYTFISTISVFADHATPNADETYPLATLPADAVAAVDSAKQITGENYGALKALSEAEVTAAFADRALIVRPGLVVGPFDYTDRFTYWVRRVGRGGDVLVPDTLSQRWQFIDGRDLALFVITMVERRAAGIYNATGPTANTRVTAGEVLETIARVSGAPVNFVTVDAVFVEKHALGAWEKLPFLLPLGAAEYAGFSEVDCSRAVAAGLHFRPLAETLHDTLAWDTARGGDLKTGLSDADHAALLALAKEHRGH